MGLWIQHGITKITWIMKIAWGYEDSMGLWR
jgi:hypothetical protein